jgi:hypothetical protein
MTNYKRLNLYFDEFKITFDDYIQSKEDSDRCYDNFIDKYYFFIEVLEEYFRVDLNKEKTND